MIDLPAFAMRMADMRLRPLVACPADATVRDAARLMAEQDTGSVVVCDPGGRAVGIVTDSDLRKRVIAAGASPDTPLRSVMSSPVVTIDASELGITAVQRMLEGRIHHLVVVDDSGRAQAVVADSDIVTVEADRPLFLARRIERAPDIAALAAARASYPRTVRALLASGATADAVAAILAETNDRVAARVLEFAQREVGAAPVPFAWLCMGTEGRRAQTLRTDQDNAIVWADGTEADAYFARLADFVVTALEQTGAPRCPGNVMATNGLWRGSLAKWKAQLERWFAEPQPQALLDALIAFDFRSAAGDARLADDLRAWVTPRVAAARGLLAHVAGQVAHRRLPLGPFGGLALDRGGEHKGSFDAKLALAPIVDGARLLALENEIPKTSTLERLAAARDRGALPATDAEEVVAAYRALQMLRLRAQLAAVDAGRPVDNRIYPQRLLPAERASLREHLEAADRFRKGLEVDRALATRTM